MSRQIDWSKPLSDEDRSWAIARGMDLQVSENDREHDRSNDDTTSIDPAIVNGIRGTEPSATSDRTETHGIGEAQLAVNRDREAAARAAAGGASQIDGGASGEDRYSTMGKEDLKDEIRERNEQREEIGLDALPLSGNKGELAERLREDDRTPRTPSDDSDDDEDDDE